MFSRCSFYCRNKRPRKIVKIKQCYKKMELMQESQEMQIYIFFGVTRGKMGNVLKLGYLLYTVDELLLMANGRPTNHKSQYQFCITI